MANIKKYCDHFYDHIGDLSDIPDDNIVLFDLPNKNLANTIFYALKAEEWHIS